MKYRYIMNGSFTPEKYEYIHDGTYHGLLCIDIPAPYFRDSKREAMADSSLSYRFVSVEGEVQIAVYPGEGFAPAADDSGHKCLYVWTTGRPLHLYNYDEFKKIGGMIYELPCSALFSISETEELKEIIAKLEERESETETTSWNMGDYEVKATFAELFPHLEPKDNPVYIDDEAYCISEEL